MKTIITIRRLAGEAGLTRQEIQTLQWQHIDFQGQCIALQTRRIPMTTGLGMYLQALQQDTAWASDYVIKGRNQNAMALSSISRLNGQEGLSLSTLRHNYIETQLKERPWQEVSRETGLSKEVLNAEFGPIAVTKTQMPHRATVAAALSQLDNTLGSLAVCLAYDGGYTVGALCELCWETLGEHVPSLRVGQLVAALKGTGYVFVNATGTVRLDAPRISRLGRDTLVRCGLDGLTLQTLTKMHNPHRDDGAHVEQLLKNHPYFTAKMAQVCFGDNKSATYRRLQRLVKEGVLVQVGGQYYDAQRVPPAHLHQALVLEMVAENGLAYRGDVEACLSIAPRHCHNLLKKLVEAGKLTQKGQKYIINE